MSENIKSIPVEELQAHYESRITENNNKITEEQKKIVSYNEAIASLEASLIYYNTLITESENKIADYTFDSEADTQTAQMAGIVLSQPQ